MNICRRRRGSNVVIINLGTVLCPVVKFTLRSFYPRGKNKKRIRGVMDEKGLAEEDWNDRHNWRKKKM
jgi:hypothetical protein